jgi:hypothetical protein
MMEKHPEEYTVMYQHFSPGVAQFISEFLPTKIVKDSKDQKLAKGPLATISISGHEKGSTALTIIESELGMSPSDSVSIANFRD